MSIDIPCEKCGHAESEVLIAKYQHVPNKDGERVHERATYMPRNAALSSVCNPPHPLACLFDFLRELEDRGWNEADLAKVEGEVANRLRDSLSHSPSVDSPDA